MEREEEFIEYYPNGAKKLLLNLKDGKPHGCQVQYYEDGTTKAELFYQRGFLHGVQRLFNEKGKIFKSLLYKDGKKLEEVFYNKEACGKKL